MNQNRFSPQLIAGIILVLFVGVALFLRIVPSYGQVFTGDWIKFTGVDAYHYMRQIDNLVHNFPDLISFDPYKGYPYASPIGKLNFFVYFLSGIIWLVGLGSPTEHTVDVVSVYFPAIVGALTIIPVYFIGRALFNRWAAVISAGLLVILDGEFLGRSLLGRTDRDAFQVLLTTLTMLFFILAVKSARQKQLTFSHLKRWDWAVLAKPLIYSLLAGASLGIYLLTWSGAFLFVIIIFVYFVVQYIIDHFGHKSTDYLCFVGTITFLIALILFLPAFSGPAYLAALVIALLTPPVLAVISWLIVKRQIKSAYYPLTLIGLGIVALVILYAINPNLPREMLGSLARIFVQPATELTVMEQEPILFLGGNFSFVPIWANFTTGFFLSLISLGILIYLATKRGDNEKTILIVWSLVILVFTLAMRRFALLFALNVALLSGYLSWLILKFTGFKETAGEPAERHKKKADFLEATRERSYYEVLGVARNATRKEIKRAYRKLASQYQSDRIGKAEEKLMELNNAYGVLSNPQKRSSYDHSEYGTAKRGREGAGWKRDASRLTTSRLKMALGVIVVFFLAFFPNIGLTTNVASRVPFAPTNAWCESLTWMKDNTPHPFGDPDFYYNLYKTPFSYPETAYGVVAWWDYGYLIIRIAHRLPNCEPGGGARDSVARFFTAQDEDSANSIIGGLNSRYIMIDYDTVIGKFYAVATYAGDDADDFSENYYMPQTRQQPTLFYPEYYRSLAVRLYNFDGKEVTPKNTTVISYREKIDQDGKPYKEITSMKSFPTYGEAEAYFSSQQSGNYRIVGTDPFTSPVPLEAVERYRSVYSSESSLFQRGVSSIPEVKVFEYIRQ